MYTTLQKIRNYDPCAVGWDTLLRYLGKRHADDEPLAIVTVLESAWEAIWVPFAETECDDNPCSRSLFVWDAASSSLAAAAAGSCFAEREKAREAEQAYQAKLFVEIFSPERKD